MTKRAIGMIALALLAGCTSNVGSGLCLLDPCRADQSGTLSPARSDALGLAKTTQLNSLGKINPSTPYLSAPSIVSTEWTGVESWKTANFSTLPEGGAFPFDRGVASLYVSNLDMSPGSINFTFPQSSTRLLIDCIVDQEAMVAVIDTSDGPAVEVSPLVVPYILPGGETVTGFYVASIITPPSNGEASAEVSLKAPQPEDPTLTRSTWQLLGCEIFSIQ